MLTADNISTETATGKPSVEQRTIIISTETATGKPNVEQRTIIISTETATGKPSVEQRTIFQYRQLARNQVLNSGQYFNRDSYRETKC